MSGEPKNTMCHKWVPVMWLRLDLNVKHLFISKQPSSASLTVEMCWWQSHIVLLSELVAKSTPSFCFTSIWSSRFYTIYVYGERPQLSLPGPHSFQFYRKGAATDLLFDPSFTNKLCIHNDRYIIFIRERITSQTSENQLSSLTWITQATEGSV